jgi:hypothetical protein
MLQEKINQKGCNETRVWKTQVRLLRRVFARVKAFAAVQFLALFRAYPASRELLALKEK